MSANAIANHPNGKAGNPPARRWRDGKRDPIGPLVAQSLGLKPMFAEKIVRDLGHRCAAVITAFRQLGDDERLAKFCEPIDKARAGREAPPDCPATWNLAQEADAAEDIAELAYHLDPTPVNRARLIRLKRESIQREIAVLDMLLAEEREAV